MRQVGWVVALAITGFTGPAWAARMAVHDMAESPEYKVKAGGMIGRGVLNVGTCFVDPIVAVVNETKDGPPVVGTLVGIGEGLGCGTLRLLSGAVDITTFWVPGFNGIPVGAEYGECFSDEGAAAVSHEPAMPAMPASAPATQQPWTSSPSMTLPSQPAAPAPMHEEKPQYSK